jgi:hypothetical protein
MRKADAPAMVADAPMLQIQMNDLLRNRNIQTRDIDR